VVDACETGLEPKLVEETLAGGVTRVKLPVVEMQEAPFW
jgi:hypothetical protein